MAQNVMNNPEKTEFRKRLVRSIKDKIKKEGVDFDMLRDLYNIAAEEIAYNPDFDVDWWISVTSYVRNQVYIMLKNTLDIKCGDLYDKVLLLEARHRFESFMLYMEKDRPYEKRFYEPRKKTLHIVADDLNRFYYSKTQKLYGLSMPARVGKSTICIFFISWVIGKNPDSNNAMGGHSGMLAKGFYKEVLQLIDSSEYNYAEVFPELKNGNRGCVQEKNAEAFTINVGKPNRFSSLTCRGIDGTWTGAVNITPDGFLYIDDLVRDREHSLSPQRMENTYQEMLNKMWDRMNDGSKVLIVGTLWSVLDPLSRLEVIYKNNPDYIFRKIPALNERDESNFDYEYNGFSTDYYLRMRDLLDDAEWQAKFMQRPFVREGLVFPTNELRTFNGYIPPDDEGAELHCCVDIAFGGGDSVSMPIGLVYPNGDVYIVDWYFSNAKVDSTVPGVARKIMKWKLPRVVFEKDNGGSLYAEKVQECLKAYDYVGCVIETKPAQRRISKVDKILGYADKIKKYFVFNTNKAYKNGTIDENGNEVLLAGKGYSDAMEELSMFASVGKNNHDDAADSLSMLAIDIYGYFGDVQTSIFERGRFGL